MIRTAVIGATGYVGGELIRLLSGHPEVTLSAVVAQDQREGMDVASIHPNLKFKVYAQMEKLDLKALVQKADLFFLALPDGKAMEIVPKLLSEKKRVIDLSGDFRLKDVRSFEKWYGIKHKVPAHLKQTVYGLPEIFRAEIKKASLVSNPGCYPTAAILGLLPALKHKIIDIKTIVIDAKSGISGTGRTPIPTTHFPECNENMRAYKIGVHDHTPEIEQALAHFTRTSFALTFTPHLVPLTRGILSTMYADLKKNMKQEQIFKLYRDSYKEEPFVRVLDEGELPYIKSVYGSNFCDMGLAVDTRTGRLIVVSVIDNLMKGAAGQAVQNMNIMHGIEETLGLRVPGLFP